MDSICYASERKTLTHRQHTATCIRCKSCHTSPIRFSEFCTKLVSVLASKRLWTLFRWIPSQKRKYGMFSSIWWPNGWAAIMGIPSYRNTHSNSPTASTKFKSIEENDYFQSLWHSSGWWFYKFAERGRVAQLIVSELFQRQKLNFSPWNAYLDHDIVGSLSLPIDVFSYPRGLFSWSERPI